MKIKIFILILVFTTPFRWTWAYDGDVHYRLNIEASGLSQGLNSILIDDFDYPLGIDHELQTGNKTYTVKEWLAYGGKAEDFGRFGNFSKLSTRAFNHFHDPLKNWAGAGLDNPVNSLYRGSFNRDPVSPILWGLDPGQQDFPDNKTGDWSWGKAREYFYAYLTGRDFSGNTVADDKADREAAFADCFRAVGQVLHLLQDMSVPLHTRNDVHILPLLGIGRWTFETYTAKNVDTGKLDYIPDQEFDRPSSELISDPQPESGYSDLPPITGLFDRNQYTGLATPDRDACIGMAEYSNANFFTNDTLCKYPHPALDETDYDHSIWSHIEEVDAEDGRKDKRIYFKKTSGEPIDHLMAAGYWYLPLDEYGWDKPELRWTFLVDKTCFADYAAKLIPRAVGYSAALLDYFFRGELQMAIDADGCYIVNPTEEDIQGRYELYYDNTNDQRVPVKDVDRCPWQDTVNPTEQELLNMTASYMTVAAGEQSDPLDIFALPEDAKTPGDFLLVMKGMMGQEKTNAVVASKITIPLIEILMPEEGFYAFTDRHPYYKPTDPKYPEKYMDNPAGQGFDKIIVNAISKSQDMSLGAVSLVVKYRQGLEDQFVSPPGRTTFSTFSQIVAQLPIPTSQGDIIPSSGVPVRLEFDLPEELPLWATDVHLFLVYNGELGAETNAFGLGYKDITEPTPIDFINLMDKICMNNTLYDAGSADAIALVDDDGDGIANPWEFDVYPHKLTNFSIRFNANSQWQYDVGTILPGEYARVFFLGDYVTQSLFSVTRSWAKTDSNDDFNHTSNKTSFNNIPGIRNQLVYGDFCSGGPCKARLLSDFSISYRGLPSTRALRYYNNSYPPDLDDCNYADEN
jgi:hypothetical protein